MKTLLKINCVFIAVILICCTSCDTDSIYKEEQYKTVVYLLSSGADNIFSESYSLSENEPVKYISIGLGGSNPNKEEIVVTLEYDMRLFDLYNSNNFNSEDEFAKRLSPRRYEIGSYTVTIPANSKEQYVRVPVKVRPLGLSPDSTYFIPIGIQSVSRYEVNEDKSRMMYHVTIENEYARQIVRTFYTKRGQVMNERTEVETVMTGPKTLIPLTGNKVRMVAGNEREDVITSVEDIEKYSVVITVKDDNTVEVTPYGSLEVEMVDRQIEDQVYNIYDPEVMQGTRAQRMFLLSYRYRILNDDNTYGDWIEVRETLTRVEED